MSVASVLARRIPRISSSLKFCSQSPTEKRGKKEFVGKICGSLVFTSRANGTRESRKERLVVSLNADEILSRGIVCFSARAVVCDWGGVVFDRANRFHRFLL